jgi:hypothetical protein
MPIQYDRTGTPRWYDTPTSAAYEYSRDGGFRVTSAPTIWRTPRREDITVVSPPHGAIQLALRNLSAAIIRARTEPYVA